MPAAANSLASVEEMLQALKISDSLSNTKLKEVVRERGRPSEELVGLQVQSDIANFANNDHAGNDCPQVPQV